MWKHEIKGPRQIEAILLTKHKLILAGTTDRCKRDKSPAFLSVRDVEDGGKVREVELASPPIYDGSAAADGRICLATADGKLTCYGKK